MIDKNLNINCVFDEEEILKKCFTFKDSKKNRDNIYKIMFVQDTSLKIIRLVLKYLLIVKKVSPYKVEGLILKWCIIVSYYFFKNTYDYDVIIPEFEAILNGEISIDNLDNCYIESENVYAYFFNKELN